MASCTDLRRQLMEVMERTAVRLVFVDLADVAFLDSSVLGIFVGAAKRCHRNNVDFYLTNPHGIAAKAIKLTGLSYLLTNEDRRSLPV